VSEAFEIGSQDTSSVACTADVRSTLKALALFASRSGLGGNITAEVAEYEARDVLFSRVGAIEVATSVAVDNNNCERSPTAVGRSTGCSSAFGFDDDLLHPTFFSCSRAENKLILC